MSFFAYTYTHKRKIDVTYDCFNVAMINNPEEHAIWLKYCPYIVKHYRINKADEHIVLYSTMTISGIFVRFTNHSILVIRIQNLSWFPTVVDNRRGF